jgi:hypothetical protein
MAFKFSSGVDKFRDALIRRMVENSYPQEYAERTFRQIEGLWRLRLSGIARREHRPDRLRLQLCPPRNGSSLVVAGNRLAFDQSYQWRDSHAGERRTNLPIPAWRDRYVRLNSPIGAPWVVIRSCWRQQGRAVSLGVHKPTAYYVVRILLWR